MLVAMGDKVLVTRGKKDPDIVAEGRWAKWTGVALRRPGMVLTIGLVLLGALIVPSLLFLLAAIKERYQATGDTRRAIGEGIARTGRPITNAAVIMIIVFIAFGSRGPSHPPSWASPSPWPSCSTPPSCA